MIDDFGEKINGAKKDRWRTLLDRMGEVGDHQIAAEPLAKSFPEPNYTALVNEGSDIWTVAFVRAARDIIPTKPRRGIAAWSEQVAQLRRVCRDLLEDDGSVDSLRQKLDSHRNAAFKSAIEGPIALYMAMGHAHSLKGYGLKHAVHKFLDGKAHNPPVERWEVSRPRTKNSREIVVIGDTQPAAIAAFRNFHAKTLEAKSAKPMSFKIYSYKSDPKTVHIGRKVGKDMIDLERFETIRDARVYRRDHHAELVEKFERLKQVQRERRTENRSRTGIDRRDGLDITPEAFSDAFGFRGVQFGNYVEMSRRQLDLNQAWDALHDLTDVMGCETRDLSLDGKLALAFGARGSGGVNPAAAHYEPVEVVINLTKNNGAGSLAHEWFHAIDNHIGKKLAGGLSYATQYNAAASQHMTLSEVRVAKSLRGLTVAMASTQIAKRSRELDRTRSTPYWGTVIEMAARSFEAYVIDRLAARGITNDYLANILDEKVFDIESEMMGLPVGRYPYPTLEEMDVIRVACDQICVTDAINPRRSVTSTGQDSLSLPASGAEATSCDELAQAVDQSGIEADMNMDDIEW